MRISKALSKIRVISSFFSTLQYRQSIENLLRQKLGAPIEELHLLIVNPEIDGLLIKFENETLKINADFENLSVEVVSNEYVKSLPQHVSSFLFEKGQRFLGKTLTGYNYIYNKSGLDGVELEFDSMPEATLVITSIYGQYKPDNFEDSLRIGICNYMSERKI